MKKTFTLKNFGCASCAAKMERAINKMPEVEEANISFITQRFTLQAEEANFDEALKKSKRVIRKIEPRTRVVS